MGSPTVHPYVEGQVNFGSIQNTAGHTIYQVIQKLTYPLVMNNYEPYISLRSSSNFNLGTFAAHEMKSSLPIWRTSDSQFAHWNATAGANEISFTYLDGTNQTITSVPRFTEMIFSTVNVQGNLSRPLKISITETADNRLTVTGSPSYNVALGVPSETALYNVVLESELDDSDLPIVPEGTVLKQGSLFVVGQSFFMNQVVSFALADLTIPCSFQVSLTASDDCQTYFLSDTTLANLEAAVVADPGGSLCGVTKYDGHYYNTRLKVTAFAQYRFDDFRPPHDRANQDYGALNSCKTWFLIS
jgi:hypothetical protein